MIAATIAAFSRWDAAFPNLLVKSGWMKYWVESITSSDTNTPEVKEAARRLLQLEAAPPEWAKRLQSQRLQSQEIAGATIAGAG